MISSASLLFIDIETVPRWSTEKEFQQKEPLIHKVWEERYYKGDKDSQEEKEAFYRKNAALYAETNKVVCVSSGKLVEEEPKIISYCFDDEESTITSIHLLLEHSWKEKKFTELCGHNILGFDIPILIKKFIKYKLTVPNWLHLHKQKPWESCIVDTMQIFRFGSTNFSSLEFLSSYYLNTSSKIGEVTGKSLADFWYKKEIKLEEKLKAIKSYCEKDVQTTMELVKLLENN
jgi:predicted PolB exonuclease-like 3'-5' exonuclease